MVEEKKMELGEHGGSERVKLRFHDHISLNYVAPLLLKHRDPSLSPPTPTLTTIPTTNPILSIQQRNLNYYRPPGTNFVVRLAPTSSTVTLSRDLIMTCLIRRSLLPRPILFARYSTSNTPWGDVTDILDQESRKFPRSTPKKSFAAGNDGSCPAYQLGLPVP